MPLPYDNEDLFLSADQLDVKYNPDGDGEHPWHTRKDWRQEVASESTLLGYWEWVVHKVGQDEDDIDEE
ncbi:MAG: hypothetical protein GX856_00440 [Gammaproteobacteria bacterium]|nr:hypothetical protein [Gammaproteobacteria bacterium]